MSSNISIASSDSDVFSVEQISNEPSPQRNNSPNILNSTEISHTHTARMPSVSSITSPEPQTLTIHNDSKEPAMPYGFGRQLPIVPPSLNDLNLPPNPLNILATMAVVTHTQDDNNDDYRPQSPEPYELSPILTPRWKSAPLTVGRRLTRRQTTTHFTPMTNPGEYFFCHQLQPRRRPESWKRNWASESPFQKEGECRSTSAKPAVRQSPQQRTSQVHQPRTRTSKTLKLIYELLNLWFFHLDI